MKFTNGCWALKEGHASFSPCEVYFKKVEDNKLILTTPTQKILQRGATLGGVLITIEITCPMEDVIRVQSYHYKGINYNEPKFELNYKNLPLDMEDLEDEIIIKNGSLSLVINKNDWSMDYRRNGKSISKSGVRDLAYIKTDWKGLMYDDGSEKDTYFTQQLSLSVGELIYGTGERFTSFIKNGQSVDIWNEDGGTSTEQSYKNIPFYVTNKGYGVFVNHPEKVSFEFASESVKKVRFSVPGEKLDYFFIDGPDIKSVLSKYTLLTGRPPLPKAWTYGLWLSTSFTTNYDEKTVMSFIDGMLDRDIPMKVFHFDCFWMKDFHWSNFIWDERVFPDPKGMLKRIKDKGLKVCVWINPYIAQESEMFDEGVKNEYFVKRKNGDTWQWDMWQPGMALVDFTNPDACKWYQSKLKNLLDMGVDCFKTDFGERIPTEVKYFDNSDPFKMHNYYTYLYNKCVHDLLVKERNGDAILFARSATVGGQKFPVHWGGDCWSDYESMAESLRGGLSLTMSGFAYWSHDIGGFESTSTPDIYKRWAAFGLLSTHSRLHGSSSYRVPWVYDEESVDVVRFFTKLKAKLMPYIYGMSAKASLTGIPAMRSMVTEFMDDLTCGNIDKQYMLGDNLLVAPILNEEGMGQFYLPIGKWTNFFTNEVHDGLKWVNEKHGYLSIPLYVRPNSVIPVGAFDNTPIYNFEKDVTLNIYELADSAETKIYDEDGKVTLTAIATRNGDEIVIKVDAKENFSVKLINLVAKDVNSKFEIIDNSTIIDGIKEIKIKL